MAGRGKVTGEGVSQGGGAPLASAPEAALGERAAPVAEGSEHGAAGAKRPPQGPPVGSAAPAAVPAAGVTPAVPQRWHAQRKRDVVLRLLRGEALDAISREIGVEICRLEEWKARALASMEAGLREREVDRDKADLDAAMKRIGELSMENELLRYKVERSGPLALRRSKP